MSDQSVNDSVPQTTPPQCCETSETEIDYDISPDLTSEQAQHLEQFLNHNADAFAQGPHDLGRTSIVQHAITTDGSPPTRQRPYRTAPSQRSLLLNILHLCYC